MEPDLTGEQEMDQEEKNIVGCMASLAGLALIPILQVFEGYCLSVMWSWFLVPLGIQKISIAHSIGIAVMIAIVAHQLQAPKNEEKKKETPLSTLLWVLWLSFSRIAMCFTIGYIAKLFM